MTALSQRVGNFWLIKLCFGPQLTIRPTLRIGPCPVPGKHKSNLKLVLLAVPPSAGRQHRNHTRPNVAYLPTAADGQLQLLTLRPSYTLPTRSCTSSREVRVYTSSKTIFGVVPAPAVQGAKDGRQLHDLTAGNLGGQTSTRKQ